MVEMSMVVPEGALEGLAEQVMLGGPNGTTLKVAEHEACWWALGPSETWPWTVYSPAGRPVVSMMATLPCEVSFPPLAGQVKTGFLRGSRYRLLPVMLMRSPGWTLDGSAGQPSMTPRVAL